MSKKAWDKVSYLSFWVEWRARLKRRVVGRGSQGIQARSTSQTEVSSGWGMGFQPLTIVPFGRATAEPSYERKTLKVKQSEIQNSGEACSMVSWLFFFDFEHLAQTDFLVKKIVCPPSNEDSKTTQANDFTLLTQNFGNFFKQNPCKYS